MASDAELSDSRKWSSKFTSWAVPATFLFGGAVLAFVGVRDGWMDDLVAGLLFAVGFVFLLPPILAKLRRRWAFLGPTWVPVVFGVLLIPLAFIAGMPFAPDSSTRLALRRDAIGQARQLISTGEFEQARYAVRRFVRAPDADGQVAAIVKQIEVSEKAKRPPDLNVEATVPQHAPAITPVTLSDEKVPDPAADYTERVQTYWLPQASRLPTSAPNGGEEYGKLLSNLETLRSYYADGEALPLNAKQKIVHLRFKQVLAAKQIKLYPSFRKRYATALRSGLFRNNVEVAAIGPSATTLRFTGGAFASNANIEDMQQSMTSAVSKMRFHRVEYRWSRYLNDGYHYDLNAKPDGDVTSGD